MKLVFATHNPGKLREVEELMPSHIELFGLTDIGLHEDIPETSATIEGNAVLKATYVWENHGMSCFADDTGLEIKALNNEPGVLSARYAGPEKDSDANMEKVLRQLEGNPNRDARFKTVIALVTASGTQLFTGICEGSILKQKKGRGGFGYDPIFQPGGVDLSFAEMPQAQKNRISHRGKAIRALISYLNDYR